MNKTETTGGTAVTDIMNGAELIDVVKDAITLLRGYAAEHQAKAERFLERGDRVEAESSEVKAKRNTVMADRLMNAVAAHPPVEQLIFSFDHEDTADVRHMILSMGGGAAGFTIDSHMKRVLSALAEAVSVGLHVRDLEDVPDMMGDIESFHQFFGLEYQGKPRMLPPGLFEFRDKFHHEEIDEYADEQVPLAEAVRVFDEDGVTKHLALQLDAQVDAVYVLLGSSYLQFGRRIFNQAWKRVHGKNMLKVRAEADEDTRSKRDTRFDVVKPEGWTPPDHTDLVTDHAHKIFRKEGSLNPGHESDTRSTL